MAEPRFNQVLLAWVEISKRRSMQEFSRWMNECGLSRSQIGTLMTLYYQGQCPVSGLGEELGITAAAASQLVDRLVQSGLLERSEDPHDRRVKQVSLSPQGRALIQQGVEARLGWMRDLADNLTPDERAEVVSALQVLIKAAEKRSPSLSGAQSPTPDPGAIRNA